MVRNARDVKVLAVARALRIERSHIGDVEMCAGSVARKLELHLSLTMVFGRVDDDIVC